MFFHHYNVLCFTVLFLTAVIASPEDSNEKQMNFGKALKYARDVVGYASPMCLIKAVYKCRNHIDPAVKDSQWESLGSCLKTIVGSHKGLCYMG